MSSGRVVACRRLQLVDAGSGRGALSLQVHLAAAMMLDSRRVDPSGRVGRHELWATCQYENSKFVWCVLGRRGSDPAHQQE
jgi:hypothetical protein